MLKKEPSDTGPSETGSHQEEIQAATMASGGKTVRPKDFDGKDNVRRFLHKFEQCAKLNGWKDDATKVGQLSVSLSDKAYDFFMRLPEAETKTYEKLKTALMNEFDSPGLQSDYAFQLNLCRRKEGQSTAEYLHELQQLAERAYPTWEDDPRSGIVKAQFINGLDSELRRQLMLQAPEDEGLEDLERRTRRIEQISSTFTSTSVGRVETDSGLAQQVAELRDQVSAVTASMAELQAGIGRLTLGAGQRRGRGRGAYRGNARDGQGGRPDVSSSAGVCYRCGVSGHFARDCTTMQPERGALCYRCGQPGHYARNCRVPPPGGFQ